MVATNITCIIDAGKFYINKFILPDEFPIISDCQVSFWNKVPKQISTNCKLFGKKNLLMYPTLSHYGSTYEAYSVNAQKNFIDFIRSNYKCYSNYFKMNFEANILGFYNTDDFEMHLDNPFYAYMVCSIPSTMTLMKKTIECKLDTEKFPILTGRIELPYNFPRISDAEISNWEHIAKKYDIGYCHPEVDTIYPYIIKDAEYAIDDYNTFLSLLSIIEEPIENNCTFNLTVLYYGDHKIIPCEFYYKTLSENALYCYTKGLREVKVFPTIVKSNNGKKFLINFF